MKTLIWNEASPARPTFVTRDTDTSLAAMTANGTVTIPAGHMIQHVVIQNTTGNAITGGIRVGTTNGGTDVVVAVAVGASALFAVLDATILKRVFSLSVDTTLYVQAVVAWNSASLNIYFVLRKVA